MLRVVPQLWCWNKGKWQYMSVSGLTTRVSCRQDEQALAVLHLVQAMLMRLEGSAFGAVTAAEPSTAVAPAQAPSGTRDASFDSAL